MMRNFGLALFVCLALGACSTQRQTVGTAAGVAAGAVVAGPVSGLWSAAPWARSRPLRATATTGTVGAGYGGAGAEIRV